MIAPVLEAVEFDDGWPVAELDHLQATIAQRLRGAGVSLSDADIASLADEVLADAIRICLAWMERG
jgi:hypothetical protein